MKPNPTDGSQNQKQSGEAWIIRGRGGNRRRIHWKEDCWQIETAERNVRRPSQSELEVHEDCGWCGPHADVDRSRTDERLHAKLQKMDPDDVGREAQS